MMADKETIDIEEVAAFINAIPDIPNDVREKEFKSKCPCGGTITAWRVKFNGHLRAMCDKCGAKLME